MTKLWLYLLAGSLSACGSTTKNHDSLPPEDLDQGGDAGTPGEVSAQGGESSAGGGAAGASDPGGGGTTPGGGPSTGGTCPGTRPRFGSSCDAPSLSCSYDIRNGCLCAPSTPIYLPCQKIDATCEGVPLNEGGAPSEPYQGDITIEGCSCSDGAWSCSNHD